MAYIFTILLLFMNLTAKAQNNPPIKSLSDAMATIEANANRDLQIYRETIAHQNRKYLLDCRLAGLNLSQCREN